MADWSASMEQSFEFYTVDPLTWKNKERLTTVRSASIQRDQESETKGSGSFTLDEDIGEAYVRAYLVVRQNGKTERFPLGTLLLQTPSMSLSAKGKTITADAYTPLVELKEKNTPIGYSILEGANIMDEAYRCVRENLRAPVVAPKSSEALPNDFVAVDSDTWLAFTTDLISNADYEFDVDEDGRILFAPVQDISALRPVWAYNDDDKSVIYTSVELDRDLYGIPNTVEVVCSSASGSYYAKAVNDDPSSVTSTVQRGRVISYRVTDPGLVGTPDKEGDTVFQARLDEYAEKLLRNLSSLEYTVSYSHGYCPVRVGDCVRINYKAAGLEGVKAKVISQTINCSTGCKVSEKAVFTQRLWR